MVTEPSYDLTVVGLTRETADATSVSFAVPAGAEEAFRYAPGQFLTLAVPSERTGVVARCYSLSSSPADDGPLTVTVKRTVDGYASHWINDHLSVGDRIRVLPPSGIFTPRSLDDDLLLWAGGSGITPIMSIVRTALAQGSGRLVLMYANRDESSVIFGPALAALAAAHPERLLVVHWLESVQGLPSRDQLRAFAAPYAEWNSFCCGPAPFMEAVADALRELGLPRSRRHQEKFVSLGGNPFGDLHQVEQAEAEIAAIDDAPGEGEPEEPAGPSGPVKLEVSLDGTDHTFDDWQPGQKLLEFLESKGVPAPFSCREGQCSACACLLLEGEVRMLHNEILDDADLADGVRLGCQSVPVTDTVKVTYNG